MMTPFGMLQLSGFVAGPSLAQLPLPLLPLLLPLLPALVLAHITGTPFKTS
jgi:hypothetical protein